jgi:hypothetical protein
MIGWPVAAAVALVGPVAVEMIGVLGQDRGRATSTLDPRRLVRNASPQTTNSSRKGRPQGGNSWSRGQMSQNQADRALGSNQAAQLSGGPDYSFNSNEITRPLRDAVNKHGWGWKAVAFKP